MFKKVYIALLAVLPFFGTAQVNVDSVEADLGKYLPPLTLLIDSAVAHSPRLSHFNAMVKKREYGVSDKKMQWTNHVVVGGSYNYGDIGQVQNSFFLGKQISVGVSIPLGAIANRRNQVNMAKSQLEAELMTYEQVKLEVQESVISTYNDLLLYQRLIGIQAEAMQSAELAMEMAEERFRRGELTMDELGTYIELQAKYKTAYETMRTNFNTTYYRLERIVGLPLSAFEE